MAERAVMHGQARLLRAAAVSPEWRLHAQRVAKAPSAAPAAPAAAAGRQPRVPHGAVVAWRRQRATTAAMSPRRAGGR